jgi:hypothetical protein
VRPRNRTAAVGVILAVGLALTGAGAAGAAGLRFRHCGTLRGPGARFSILAYHARCATARHVFGALFAGKGRRRKDPSTGQIDRVIDGWICGSGAGGFGCAKLGPHGTILPYKPGQPSINAEATGPAPAVTHGPPCARKALAAGLKRGTNKIPGAPIEGFRCAGRWAIAAVLDGVDDVPVLFHARGTRWVTVDRAKPCQTHAVPKKIYASACLAS